MGGPAGCVTGRVHDIIASSFSSFFFFFFALTTSPLPPTGLTRIPPVSAVHPPSLANARRRMLTQQESNFCWVQLFVDKGAYTHRSSGALAHLHVCSTRRPDYFATYPPPSLASASRRIFAPCEESDSRTVLISNAKRIEYAATVVRSSPEMSVPPDIPISFRRRLRRLQRRGGGFFAHAKGQTSACSFPMSGRGCLVTTTARTGTPFGTSVQPDAPSCLPLGFVDFVDRFHCIPYKTKQ